MATSSFPIEFDSTQIMLTAASVGSRVDYFDYGNIHFGNPDQNTLYHMKVNSQFFYVQNSRIYFRIKDSSHTENIAIADERIGSISKIRFDNPSNGNLYFSIGYKIFKYHYAMDISPYVTSWDYSMKTDSPVYQLNCELQNIKADWFANEYSLFQPGSNVTLKLYFGNSGPVSICNTWVDECGYDITQETVSISGRNNSGFLLKDQTMNNYNVVYGWDPSDIIADILYKSLIPDYAVDSLPTYEEGLDIDISRSDSFLDIINAVLANFEDCGVREDSDGKVYAGTGSWLEQYFPSELFIFNEFSDVFSRKTTRSNDAAYSYVRASSRQADGADDLESGTYSINNYQQWNIPPNRFYYATAPEGITQEALEQWTQDYSKKLQYIGITEDITLSLHPEVLIGDIGAIKKYPNAEEAIKLGLINEVTHSFSKNNGFQTRLMIDSGGDYSNRTGSLYTGGAKIFGYNRRQNIVDILRMAIDASKDKFKDG